MIKKEILIIMFICLLLPFFCSFLLFTPTEINYTKNEGAYLFEKVVEKKNSYNASYGGAVAGTEIGSYTDTFVQDLNYHKVVEFTDLGGSAVIIIYGFIIEPFNISDFLRFEINIYLSNNLSEDCNIMIENSSANPSENYLLGSDSNPAFHWWNYTFFTSQPSDFIDGDNTVRITINDSTYTGDFTVDDIKIDYIQLSVVYDIHDITKPVFLSYPNDLNHEQFFNAPNASWIVSEANPDKFFIYRNMSLLESGTYTNASTISCKLNVSVVGIWNYTILVTDKYNNNNSLSFLLTIDPKKNPTLIQYPNNREFLKDSSNYLIWRINEKFPDKYIILVNNTIINSGSYSNDTDIPILVDTSIIGTYLYKLVVNDTSNNTLEHTVLIKIVSEYSSPEGGFDLVTLFIIIAVSLSAGIGMMLAYSRVKRKREAAKIEIIGKKEKLYKDFLDVFNTNQVFLILKESGVVLSNAIFRKEHHIDDDLIGSFLSAISTFGQELAGGKLKRLDFEGFKTSIISGELTKVAVLFTDEPSKNFEEKLVEFVQDYELENLGYLKTFMGDISRFRGFRKEFVEFFNMLILKNHKLILPSNKIILTQLQKKIINICKRYGLEFTPRRIGEIIELCIKELNVPEYETFVEIIQLKKLNILNPVSYIE